MQNSCYHASPYAGRSSAHCVHVMLRANSRSCVLARGVLVEVTSGGHLTSTLLRGSAQDVTKVLPRLGLNLQRYHMHPRGR